MSVSTRPLSGVNQRRLLAGGLSVAGVAALLYRPGLVASTFSTQFLPHRYCYLGNSRLIWLHVVSDMLIGLSYVAISAALLYLVRKARHAIPFNWMLIAFGTFIVACGFTHFMEVGVIWKPVYWLSGYVKVVTALASVVTAIALPTVVPKVLGLVDIAQVAEQRFRDLLESAPDAMVIVDAKGNIALINAQTERLFGFARAELLGQKIEVLMPDRYRPRHGGHREGFFADPHARPMEVGLELFGLKSDGTEFPVDISLSPLKTREGTYVTAAIRDITERKRAQESMAQQTMQLAQANEELASINQELEAFTYSVSHDLRAPLRHIDGFSKILVEEAGAKLDDECQRYLARIREGSQHMGRLVDDLLNLARVGRSELNLQLTGLNSVVEKVVGDLRPEMQDRKIKFQIGRLPFVECDPALMHQVFLNLLSNAMKYTRPREQAVIEVDQAPVNGGQSIYVRDNGVGFSMKYADKLFGVFQRLHRQEDFEGTGVGLATVQRIVRKHGGRVWAEAELDEGATFYFTLGAPEKGTSRAVSSASERN